MVDRVSADTAGISEDVSCVNGYPQLDPCVAGQESVVAAEPGPDVPDERVYERFHALIGRYQEHEPVPAILVIAGAPVDARGIAGVLDDPVQHLPGKEPEARVTAAERGDVGGEHAPVTRPEIAGEGAGDSGHSFPLLVKAGENPPAWSSAQKSRSSSAGRSCSSGYSLRRRPVSSIHWVVSVMAITVSSADRGPCC
ncbi:MAG TPA: hypothetical protein VN969_05635 [Streptosporangiaceae bacterium]|nr:hypothetical protein [Streptosporangiaceae bacterium]